MSNYTMNSYWDCELDFAIFQFSVLGHLLTANPEGQQHKAGLVPDSHRMDFSISSSRKPTRNPVLAHRHTV